MAKFDEQSKLSLVHYPVKYKSLEAHQDQAVSGGDGAHRPETIQMAERVIVLHNGRVAQDVTKPIPEDKQAA